MKRRFLPYLSELGLLFFGICIGLAIAQDWRDFIPIAFLVVIALIVGILQWKFHVRIFPEDWEV